MLIWNSNLNSVIFFSFDNFNRTLVVTKERQKTDSWRPTIKNVCEWSRSYEVFRKGMEIQKEKEEMREIMKNG